MIDLEPDVYSKVSKLPFEEKLRLLSDSDKDYLRGYIDRALSAVSDSDKDSILAMKK